MIKRHEAGSWVAGDPEKAAKAEVRVTKRPGDRLSEAAGVLARSYHDHPNFIDFFPDEKVRAGALSDVCAAGLRDALGFGHVYAAMRGGKIVGVATQGLGAGTRLLEPVLSLADAAGQSCYLETQTERNVAWHRKLGFEVKEAGVRFVPAGPPNWTMIRPPVRDQTARDRKAGGPDGQGGTT